MIKTNFFLPVFFLVSFNLLGQDVTISDKVINEFMSYVVADTNMYFEGGKCKSMTYIASQYIPWDTFSFTFPKEWLPKSPADRIGIVHSNTDHKIGSREYLYECFYVFADPETDSLYTETDKNFMIAQAQHKNDGSITFESAKFKMISYAKFHKLKRKRSFYGYTVPVFSIDHRKAIVARYTLSS